MRYLHTTGALAALTVLVAPYAVGAADSEIHYQSVESVYGDTVVVLDESPGGDSRYRCDAASGSCRTLSDDEHVQPALFGTRMYETSSQGTYGATSLAVPVDGIPTTFITLFDITESTPEVAGFLTVTAPIVTERFSPDESAFIVITNDGTVHTYDLTSGARGQVTIGQTDLPFLSISHRGTYVSAYNYVARAHHIWNTRTGARTEVPGAESYVEFSDDEREAAFIVERDGYRNLAVARHLDGTPETETVASGAFTVEDYRYLGDTLLYMANRESPLSWALYEAGTSEPVAEHASYGDYLKRVGDRLAYLKIEGKNANVYLYDPGADTHTRLRAAPQSASEDGIVREEIEIAGRSAAHLAPTDGDGEHLVVWLHGGPQRQTSLGYHPYRSYAVYDELLERIAAAGNHVLKLDYSGSWGYGQDFLERLEGRVGTVEITDVRNAIDEFTGEHDVEDVYLIGNSYGGYMAFRAINEIPEQIDGIVSINGVADWHTLIATIPSSPFSRLFNGSPDLHNLALYRSASVFTNFDGLGDQPLLVFYGTEDRTVPVRQSLQYHEFMEAQGKNVTLVPLAGEAHTLRERSTLTTVCETISEELDLSGVSCR